MATQLHQNPEERLHELAELLGHRGIPAEVEEHDGRLALRLLSCPYYELAKKDRTICEMEKQMISSVAGAHVHLHHCQLDDKTDNDAGCGCEYQT